MLADPPDAGSAPHEHDDHGGGAHDHVHEQERALSAALVEKVDAGSAATPDAKANPHKRGPWVSATVGSDGIARFEDRSFLSAAHVATWYDQQYTDQISKTLPPESGKDRGLYDPVRDAPLITARFRFDLFDLVGDRNHAARAQIVDKSERLRTQLSLQDRLCSSLDSRALREYLGETLPRLPAPAHKHALFETYDACADSVLGALARKLIQQAAERSFPRSSEHAFTPAELKTLNDERVASYRFEPYELR